MDTFIECNTHVLPKKKTQKYSSAKALGNSDNREIGEVGRRDSIKRLQEIKWRI